MDDRTTSEGMVPHILAISWASIGLLAWLSTVTGVDGQITSSSLTILAGLAFLIGVVLRKLCLSLSGGGLTTSNAAVSILFTVGNVNWFGCFTAYSDNLQEAVPVLILFLSAESLTWKQLCRSVLAAWSQNLVGESHIEWPGLTAFTSSSSTADARSSGVDASQEVTRGECNASAAGMSTFPHPGTESSSPTMEFVAATQNASGDSGDRVVRRTQEGVDAQGRRYISGTVIVRMLPRQTSKEVLVGFCPAFEGDPNIEFEVDHEAVEARLATSSPAGMRVFLRRSISAERLDVALEWYAAQRSEKNAEAAGERVLP